MVNFYIGVFFTASFGKAYLSSICYSKDLCTLEILGVWCLHINLGGLQGVPGGCRHGRLPAGQGTEAAHCPTCLGWGFGVNCH